MIIKNGSDNDSYRQSEMTHRVMGYVLDSTMYFSVL